ncbi:MAG: DUF58 domain-containing protein [Thermoplasmatales archaeon]
MLYTGIVYIDLLLVVVSILALLSVLVFGSAAFFLLLKSRQIAPQTLLVNGDAGQPVPITLSFDFPWPIIFFTCRLKEVDNELFQLRSERSFLGFQNKIRGTLMFNRRSHGYFFANILISSPADLFQIEIDGYVKILNRILPHKLSFENSSIDSLFEEGSLYTHIGSGSGDPLNLRPYHPGDPMKRIAWKIFGKRRELITRELERSLDETDTIFILADPLVTDEPLANLALKIRNYLLTASPNIWYGTTVSGEIYQDQDRFYDEILVSGSTTSRVALQNYINSIQGMIFGATVILLISDDKRNVDKINVINSLDALCNLRLIVAPKFLFKRTLETTITDLNVAYDISYDQVFSKFGV